MPDTLTPVDLPVFRAGRHTDSGGHTREWTEADLDTIAQQYDRQIESGDERPAVCGHPADDSSAPARGWLKKLWRKGSELWARMEPTPELVEDVRANRYRYRSMAFYPDLRVRHLGILGGNPPALKGLPALSFADDPTDLITVTLDFAEGDTTDSPMTPEEITALGEAVAAALKPQFDAVTEAIAALKPAETTEEEKPAEEEGGGGETPEFAENQRLTTENAELKQQLRAAEFAAFLDSDEVKGRVIPANRAMLLRFMEQQHDAPSMEFGEGDAKRTLTGIEAAKEFIRALPVAVQFGEQYTNGTAAPVVSDHQKLAASAVEAFTDKK